MKHVRKGVEALALSLVVMLGAGAAWKLNPAVQTAEVVIQDVHGAASYSTGGDWRPLQKDMKVGAGATIRTDAGSTVDFLLYASRTALRLMPNSSLRLDKLTKVPGADRTAITDSRLTLLFGSVAGTQRKLAAPSRFQINLPNCVATIVGTEYLVRADGAVTVLSGTVSVNYNQPGNGGDVKVDVPAGYSFDPGSGQVVATTAAYTQNIIADITTTRNNAEVFRVDGATVVVRADQPLSRFTPGNNGVGNGIDPQPPGNPPINDGPGTSPGNPGNRGGPSK